MRTGGYLAGTPEAALINVVCLEMSRFYGLPSGGSAITCDSRTCDLQAGVESALTGAACVLAGAEVLLAAGLVDGARTASLAKTVLDADTIAAITRMAHGDVVTPESALIEDILAVGIGGQFVTRPSSRRDGGSELWRPATWSREPTSGRTAGDLVREAAARAEDLIAASQTAPLPEEVLTLAEDILGRPLARVA